MLFLLQYCNCYATVSLINHNDRVMNNLLQVVIITYSNCQHALKLFHKYIQQKFVKSVQRIQSLHWKETRKITSTCGESIQHTNDSLWKVNENTITDITVITHVFNVPYRVISPTATPVPSGVWRTGVFLPSAGATRVCVLRYGLNIVSDTQQVGSIIHASHPVINHLYFSTLFPWLFQCDFWQAPAGVE